MADDTMNVPLNENEQECNVKDHIESDVTDTKKVAHEDSETLQEIQLEHSDATQSPSHSTSDSSENTTTEDSICGPNSVSSFEVQTVEQSNFQDILCEQNCLSNLENDNSSPKKDSPNKLFHNCSCEDLLKAEKDKLLEALKFTEDLQMQNSNHESEIEDLKLKLRSQEIAFNKAESQIRAEFFSNIEKLSKECNTLRKEKEAIVIRYANSEKEVIIEKKIQQDLEKKLKDACKERENLLTKLKALNAENSRLSSCNEVKTVEIAKLQKDVSKINADSHSKEIRIKWLQNKLKTETTSHEETQAKLDQTIHRLNEMKEEAEQVRKDCQEMIKCYQEAEEIKSVKLDGQLKQKVCELEIEKQEKTDQEQVYLLLRQELEALKKNQRMTMEENNSLKLKIHSLEKERLEYEQNLSKLKDSQNLLKQEVVDLTARLAEMETLQLQLEREREKSAASLREVERLRLTNSELQADMNACHVKEGELLKFTEGVTDTNVKLQSAHSLLEVKAQALEDELVETKKELSDILLKNSKLVLELETAQKQQEEEMQLLARKLAEKTKNIETLNTRLYEADNENRVFKRRHLASVKELSRELQECKRRLDGQESNNSIRIDSSSLGSRSSSTVSLDAVNSNDRNFATATSVISEKKEIASPSSNASTDIPGVDKEMLIERIIKLQKTLAQRNDKIDFLEDHIVQLIKEMNKKSKCDLKAV